MFPIAQDGTHSVSIGRERAAKLVDKSGASFRYDPSDRSRIYEIDGVRLTFESSGRITLVGTPQAVHALL